MNEKDKGQNKEINNPSLFFWNGTDSYSYTFKKVEKILTALYLVTNLISDTEPLKWKIRKLGHDILSLTGTLKDRFGAQYDEVIRSFNSLVMEMVSLLEIGYISGLMSFMNAHIIKDELIKLVKEIIENQDRSTYSKSFLFDESFFDITKKTGVHESSQRQKSTKELVSKTTQRVDDKEHKRQFGHRHGSPHADTLEKRENRRKVILDLIKKNNNVTVKDVSGLIKDCSEKTLQRELLALVSEGVLEKVGERRWSRYSLSKT